MNDTYTQAGEPPDAPRPTSATPAKGSSAFQVFSILLLIAAVALLGVIAFQQRTEERWTYVVVSPKDENLVKDLDELGAMGYEVVAARRATSDDPDKKTAYEMILKRRGPTTLCASVTVGGTVDGNCA